MSRTANIFRAIWRWWAYFCGVVGLLLVCLLVFVTLKQSRKDKAFAETQLVPLASYVEAFRDSHHRLPLDTEFQAWVSTNRASDLAWYYFEKPSFMSDWGSPGRDFVVGAWRGEWIEYYRSWDRKTFEVDTPNKSLQPTATAPSVLTNK
jgi:predicted membrane-bound mannosyltransferase